LTSCEFSVTTNTEKKQELDLREMPEVEKQTFKNIYVADENICRNKKNTNYKICYRIPR
jgi:hypothetical protein